MQTLSPAADEDTLILFAEEIWVESTPDGGILRNRGRDDGDPVQKLTFEKFIHGPDTELIAKNFYIRNKIRHNFAVNHDNLGRFHIYTATFGMIFCSVANSLLFFADSPTDVDRCTASQFCAKPCNS
jgi:hypothetical protein